MIQNSNRNNLSKDSEMNSKSNEDSIDTNKKGYKNGQIGSKRLIEELNQKGQENGYVKKEQYYEDHLW